MSWGAWKGALFSTADGREAIRRRRPGLLCSEDSDPRAPSWRRSSLAGGGQAARGELLILSNDAGRFETPPGAPLLLE
jgi:hypothetical protein